MKKLESRLSLFRKHQQKTLKDMAELIGVDLSTYKHYEAGSRKPKADKLEALMRAFPQISPEWLLTGNGKMLIEEWGQTTGGAPVPAWLAPQYIYASVLVAHEDIGKPSLGPSPMAFHRPWLTETLQAHPGYLYTVRYGGRGMEPTVVAGDWLLVDAAQNNPMDGEMFLIHRAEREHIVRRTQTPSGSAVRLLCDNPQFESETLRTKGKERDPVVGRVLLISRKV